MGRSSTSTPCCLHQLQRHNSRLDYLISDFAESIDRYCCLSRYSRSKRKEQCYDCGSEKDCDRKVARIPQSIVDTRIDKLHVPHPMIDRQHSQNNNYDTDEMLDKCSHVFYFIQLICSCEFILRVKSRYSESKFKATRSHVKNLDSIRRTKKCPKHGLNGKHHTFFLAISRLQSIPN